VEFGDGDGRMLDPFPRTLIAMGRGEDNEREHDCELVPITDKVPAMRAGH